MKAAHAVWCEACERRCYAATAGGRWQLSWRVGRGMPHVRYFEPELAECKVLAKQPPSALPGSFLRLAEVVGEHVRVWMHCDANALAASRLELLQQLDARLCEPSGADERVWRWAKRWTHGCAHEASQDVELFRSLGELAEAMGRVRLGGVQARCASGVVRADDDAGPALLDSSCAEPAASMSSLWTSAVSAACSEAAMLAVAWRALDRTLADAFAAVAETLPSRRPKPLTPRVRRSVQEVDLLQPSRSGLTRRHA
jgi:hypothetical protein